MQILTDLLNIDNLKVAIILLLVIYMKFSMCNSFQVTSDFTHYGSY